ncbi:hypothetical protein RMO66_10895 [Nocardia seriolae]|nr:hypothetical protein [Nocardia seriolae]WNJ61154.1 hypothetical protein RMO66_10895 [Nocardia seriolae]
MTVVTNRNIYPGDFPENCGKFDPAVGTTRLTWHNKPHDWTWSTTRGASPCRFQACLQRELSAGEPPVDRPHSPGTGVHLTPYKPVL